jgi:hypothetical protein
VYTPYPHHPTPDTLRAYGLGKLDDASAKAVHEHLDDCLECRRHVAELSPDSFLGSVRDARKGPQTSIVSSSGPGVLPTGSAISNDAIADSSASPCMSSTGQVDETSDALNSPADTSLPSGTRIGYFGDYELLKARG